MQAEHKHYCERCGAELLPADPAPLCVTCWVSDTSVTAPALLLTNDDTWNARAAARPQPSNAARKRPSAPAPSGPHVQARRGVPTHVGAQAAASQKPRHPYRTLSVAAAGLIVVALMLAIVPAAISGTTPGPVHLGVQQVDKATDAVLADLYTLSADKIAHRDSPADIVCPVNGQPYIYSQYEGVTTISCPDPGALGHLRIYIKTDVNVPVVN